MSDANRQISGLEHSTPTTQLPRYEDYPLPFAITVIEQSAQSFGITSSVENSPLGIDADLILPVGVWDGRAKSKELAAFCKSLTDLGVPTISEVKSLGDMIGILFDKTKLGSVTLGLVEKLKERYGEYDLGAGYNETEASCFAFNGNRLADTVARAGQTALVLVSGFITILENEPSRVPQSSDIVIKTIYDEDIVLMLSQYPVILRSTHDGRSADRLSKYVKDLGACFGNLKERYMDWQVNDAATLTTALNLSRAVQQVLFNSIRLLTVPENITD